MSDVVIRAENLGKKYLLGRNHGAGRLAGYQRTFRDAISEATQNLLRRNAAHVKEEEFWALRDVSFEVREGGVVGIVARNGAGKSTLLKLLSRITEPTTGKVRIKGRVASLLEVGTGFHPELTGRENIYLNGAILGMSRAEITAKFEEIVSFAELERFLDTPVKRYSSGMYVRLAFAVAAHLEPEILVVDEVLAVGDIGFQKKCLGKMEAVAQRQGRTVLFVSHNLDAVRRLCAQAILLRSGQIEAYDKTDRVLQLYTQTFDAGELSQVPPPSPDLLDRGYVTGVHVESADGRGLPAYSVGEDWRIRVGFHLSRAMQEFVIAVGFLNSEGIPVQTAWASPRSLQAGDYEAVFIQNSVRFAAGNYTVIVGLTERDQAFQQMAAARVDITGDAAVGYYGATSGYGLILNSMSMDVRPV
jgi:lipopolysaccharide transport system ATP-binding protein